MKFGNHTLTRAGNVQAGDKVCFELGLADYVVTDVDTTAIGMVRHHHETGSSSYWPNELVYVEER